MMGTFDYTAKDVNENIMVGTYEDIESAALLRQELEKMGYTLITSRRQKKTTPRKKKIRQSEIVTFIYKFSEMYSAGLSITRILEVLEEQSKNQSFRQVITNIRQDIENGSNLEMAFKKHSYIFTEFFTGMLEAGESGGNLTKVLEMSAEYLEKQMDMRHKIRSAMTYPIVVGSVCIGVVSCLIIFIVPIFSKLYKQLHVQLPGPTQMLLYISLLLRCYWWAIPFIGAVIYIIIWRLRKNPAFQTKWDAFKLDMPIIGKINRMVVVTYFTRTFGMLTSVGISPIRALEVASAVAHNQIMSGISRELQAAVEKGQSIGMSLKKFNIFPPMIVQLALSGEEVGQMAQMITKGADFLDKDIDRLTNALVVKLEPILTVIMGTIIGFILLAVYLPMFDYMRHLE